MKNMREESFFWYATSGLAILYILKEVII